MSSRSALAHPVVLALVTLSACGGAPWKAEGVPSVPPDEQFRTGVEAGEDVFVWHCYEGARVMVSQFGTACLGTRRPVVERGPCGTPLPGEARFAGVDRDAAAEAMPEAVKWPGTPQGTGAGKH